MTQTTPGLTNHKVMADGSVTHEDLTKATWESGMHDAQVLRQWGHPTGECYDPVARHWDELRKSGRKLSEWQHAFADINDPAWVGERNSVTVVVGPPPEPIFWPPQTELTPWMLCQMTSTCMDDARGLLRGQSKKVSAPTMPVANKQGQFSLF